MPGTDIVGGDFTKTSRGDPRRDEVGEIELCRGEAQPPKRAHIQEKYIHHNVSDRRSFTTITRSD